MTTMGRKGLQEVAHQCAQKAHYAAREISKLDGYTLPYSAPFFNEFVVRAPIEAHETLRRLARDHNLNGGVALSRYFSNQPNDLLVCVTETNSRAEIDALVTALASIS
jgi:glycine dehydrogenase subunit 1